MKLIEPLVPLSRPPALQHYLATHLTGAAGATSMLRSLAARLDADDLREVVAELEKEQRELRAVATALGLSPSPLTRGVAKTVELLSRAGRGAQGLYDDDLRNLAELEAMITGINGKKAMWRLLPTLAGDYPPLADLDYPSLLSAAERQEAVVEAHRVAQGERALGRGEHQ